MATATGPVSGPANISQDRVQGLSRDALQHFRNRVSSRHAEDVAQEEIERPSLSLNGVPGQRCGETSDESGQSSYGESLLLRPGP